MVDSLQTLVYDRSRQPRARSSDAPLQAPGREEGQLLLGRYRLLEHLGSGGFAVVWRAHDEQLGREIALKRIPLPAAGDIERAKREAKATARLSHPAIVSLLEAHWTAHEFYLVSELVEGDTLKQLIVHDALDDEEVLEIGVALAQALEHAHARGVIHRDLKPQNVLVPSRSDETSEAPAKLADFGGASLAGEDALTRTGDVLGTLAYMAPEQSEGLPAGPEADLYSLALVLYEALSGVNPVRGATPAETARRLGEPIEPLRRHRRDLPPALSDTLARALDPEPVRRGTVAQLRDELELLLREDSEPAGGSTAAALPGEPLPAPLHDSQEGRQRRWYELPRICWWLSALAAIVWQLVVGNTGVALLLLAAALPLIGLRRRSSPAWISAALAAVFGLVGLAGSFPAVAGQAGRWRARGYLGALGYWWLVLAEPLSAQRLWLASPQHLPARGAWEGSLTASATHVVYPLLSVGVLLGCALWAAAAMILPWIVRGRSVAVDVVAATAWTAALAAAEPLLDRGLNAHSSLAAPRGLIASAVACGALAVAARAVRTPL